MSLDIGFNGCCYPSLPTSLYFFLLAWSPMGRYPYFFFRFANVLWETQWDCFLTSFKFINTTAEANVWNQCLYFYSMALRNRLISDILELVLMPTENSCISLFYRPFSMNIRKKKHKINTSFLSPAFGFHDALYNY